VRAIASAIALADEFVREPAIARFFAATVDSLIGSGQRRLAQRLHRTAQGDMIGISDEQTYVKLPCRAIW
jgi:hypothetical protein